VLTAYKKAKKELELFEKNLEEKQEKILQSSKLKILLVSHPYNTYDEYIGTPVVKFLKKLDADVLFADIPNSQKMMNYAKKLSPSLYFQYNKEIIGSITHYSEHIDGIIFLTSFPCGPDSLVVDLLIRKLKGIPMTNIVIDALQGEAGLHTRIESFVDIIIQKRKELK
jgi:predicted nucleotide-binding protein (sugar kinase/HSP70/actin superfamily)